MKTKVVLTATLSLGLADCGLANQTRSVVWTAALNSMPDPACARDAVASAPEVSGADVTPRPAGYVYGAHVKNGNALGPDIYVVMTREGREPVQFRMSYGDYQTGREARENAAHGIVTKLAANCGVPELAMRAKETRGSEWRPYLFNI